MRILTEYLSTKIQKHINVNFPENQNESEIVGFLENKGFKCLDKCETIAEFKKAMETSDYPLYNIVDHAVGRWVRFANKGRWIRFAKNGYLDETNPFFACGFTNEPPKVLAVRWGLEPHKCKTYKNYDDFRNKVNEFFDWK